MLSPTVGERSPPVALIGWDVADRLFGQTGLDRLDGGRWKRKWSSADVMYQS